MEEYRYRLHLLVAFQGFPQLRGIAVPLLVAFGLASGQHSGVAVSTSRAARQPHADGAAICINWTDVNYSLPIRHMSLPVWDDVMNLTAIIAIATVSFGDYPEYNLSDAQFSHVLADASAVSCVGDVGSLNTQPTVLTVIEDADCPIGRLACSNIALRNDSITRITNLTMDTRQLSPLGTPGAASSAIPLNVTCPPESALVSIVKTDDKIFHFTCVHLVVESSAVNQCLVEQHLSQEELIGRLAVFYLAMLAVMVTIGILFNSLRRVDRGKHGWVLVRVQIAIRLGTLISLLLVLLLAGAKAPLEPYTASCHVMAALFHYVIMTFSAWSSLDGLLLHQHIRNVYYSPPEHCIAKCIVAAQGIPLLILTALLAAVGDNYDGLNEVGQCFVNMDSVLVYYVFYNGPVLLFSALNIFVFMEVLWILMHTPRGQGEKRAALLKRFRGSIAIFFVLGLGWVPTIIKPLFGCLGRYEFFFPIIALPVHSIVLLGYHIGSERSALTLCFRAVVPIEAKPSTESNNKCGSGSGSDDLPRSPPV